MFIRMTDGRDRGRAIDVLEETARELVARGQALAIDFNEPDPLRQLAVVAEVLPAALSPEVSTFVDSLVITPGGAHLPVSSNGGDSVKPPAGHLKRRGR